MSTGKIKFSVLMAVYKNDITKDVKLAIDSLLNQTLLPNQIVIMVDGPIGNDLENLLDEYSKNKLIEIHKRDINLGLGITLNEGLNYCKYDFVARMDADDICRNDRFEIQLKYLNDNPSIDVLGSNIYEFKESLNENMRKKKMPSNSEINNYIKKRNPINHMTVCFKKSSVIECGGYQPMLYLEDYYLWIRMLEKGKKIFNIQDELVFARIGNGFEKRRGNKKQIIGWKKLQKFMLEKKMINHIRYFINISNMYLLVYCPDFVRRFTYKTVLRKDG